MEKEKDKEKTAFPLLPIHLVRDKILQLVENNQCIVLTGDTGSGKSTQLSKMLYEAGYAKKGLIGVTQPRRIGAVSLAKRVAEELDVEVGEEVGYSIRFENVTSDKTRIKYMTDGCLLRECLQEDLLQSYSVIILDEAHERSLQTDILFGVVKAIVKKRKDLKLIVTSATLDVAKFSRFFFNCPTFAVEGRCFPVQIHHSEKTERYYVQAAVDTVLKIHTQRNEAKTHTGELGHVLVFLTGQEQIEQACKLLGDKLDSLYADGVDMPDIVILPVYAALPASEQRKIFKKAPPNCRKVLMATNICETSLTVDGVVYVVDAGYVKQRSFNAKTGIDALVVIPISKSAAVQRAGRAGRTMSGQCYRLYSLNAFEGGEMQEVQIPEIQRTQLSSTVLILKSLGIADPLSFEFLDNPSSSAILDALRQLFALSAISATGELTPSGTAMSNFPVEPHLAHVLMTASHPSFACSQEVLSIVAMLSIEQLWLRPGPDEQTLATAAKTRLSSAFGDHISLLFIFDSFQDQLRKGNGAQWCKENFLSEQNLKKAANVRKQLADLLRTHVEKHKNSPALMAPLAGQGLVSESEATAHVDAVAAVANAKKEKEKNQPDTSSFLGSYFAMADDGNEGGKDLVEEEKKKETVGAVEAYKSSEKRVSRRHDSDDDRSPSRSRSRDAKRRKRSRSRSKDDRKSKHSKKYRERSKDEHRGGESGEKLVHEDLITRVRMAFARSYYCSLARRVDVGSSKRGSSALSYRRYLQEPIMDRAQETLLVHPSSTLSDDSNEEGSVVAPKWIIFHEMVYTTKPYIRNVMAVEFDWVSPWLAHYKSADNRKLTGRSEMPEGAEAWRVGEAGLELETLAEREARLAKEEKRKQQLIDHVKSTKDEVAVSDAKARYQERQKLKQLQSLLKK